MADDLDDEWWVDQKNTDDKEEISPSSDSEKEQENVKNDVKKLKQAKSPKPDSNKKKNKKQKDKQKKVENKVIKEKVEPTKRKQEEAANGGTSDEPPAKKKRKRKLKSEELAAQPVTGLTPETLVNALSKHYKDKLSTVEWDELALDTSKHFCECNDMTHNPVSYLKTVFPKWAKAVEKGGAQGKPGAGDEALKPGSPLVLIITQAALRATQLNREITDFKGKDCKTAKLFAKHFKLQDQIKFLSKNTVHLGLGTPSRIQALLESDGLHLDSVRRVVLDWSWRDVKLRRMVEIPELRTQLFDLLRKYIIPRLKDSTCKIGLM